MVFIYLRLVFYYVAPMEAFVNLIMIGFIIIVEMPLWGLVSLVRVLFVFYHYFSSHLGAWIDIINVIYDSLLSNFHEMTCSMFYQDLK